MTAKRRIMLFACLGIALCTFTYLSVPRDSTASDDGAGYSMFGVDGTTGYLMRYDLCAGSLTSIGEVVDRSGNSYADLGGMAYIPGHSNLTGFWTDDEGVAHIVYVNASTAVAAIVGNDLGVGEVTGATTLPKGDGRYQVYALQNQTVSSGEETEVAFEIDDGEVTPSSDYAARVSIVGAAIGTSDYDAKVTVRVGIGTNTYTPFGSFDSPTAGNVNDGQQHHYTNPNTFPANTSIHLTARSWVKKRSNFSGSSDSHWEEHMTVDTNDGTTLVKVLRNGDSVPDIAPMRDQASIADYLSAYIDGDTNTVTLEDNQIIYLFEIGTDDLDSDAADFQDLVAVVTLGESAAALDEAYGQGGTIAGLIRVNPNNASDLELILEHDEGQINHAALLEVDSLPSDGVLYQGSASSLRIKPGGGGSQTSLTFNDAVYDLQNSTVYTLTGDLTVTVYNDRVNGNGGPMGQWYITVDGENIRVVSGDESSDSGSKLVKVDHITGDTELVVSLTRSYDSLAAIDSSMFYAMLGDTLYAIDPVTGNETEIGSLTVADNYCLEFLDDVLMDFSSESQRLLKLNTNSGSSMGHGTDVGMTHLKSMVFMKNEDAPRLEAYD